MSKFLISFLFLVSLLFSESSHASVHRGGAELLNAKAYSVILNASVFSTTALFDEAGTEKPMNSGDKFRMIDTDLKLSYGISNKLETSLLFKFRNINASTQSVTASNTGPESAGVEAKYSFGTFGKMSYALGVHYRQTLYTNTVYPSQATIPTNTIILGDDGTEYGVGMFATFNSRPWKLDSSFQYVSPPNDLSSEIHYKMEGIYFFSKLSLLAGVEGIYSLNRDQLVQKPFFARGPTNIFNSLNRQYVAPYAGINYAFDKIFLSLKGQSIVAGHSTDKGNAASINIAWNSQGVTAESIKVESFKEYHIEGSVLKVSARGNFIKIDQGLSTDVEKGMKFDIYQTDYFGGNVLVASGVAYDVGADWTVIKLTKKYKEIEIKPGFAARGY